MEFCKDSQPAIIMLIYASLPLALTALITEEISTAIVFLYLLCFQNNFIFPPSSKI